MAVPAPRSSSRRFVTAGLLLGVGLGGFVDGIVLHQILQWHHMLTSTDTDNLGLRDYPATTVEGLEVNTLWDGLFHASTWMFVAVGLALLWRAWQQRQAPRAGRSWSGCCWPAGGCSTWSRVSSTTTCSASTTSSPATISCCSTSASSPLARCCWPAAGRCTALG